jgi:acetate CoA/acetoacetate CoA-transferase alpha subunit
MTGSSAEARRGQIKAGEFSRPPTLDGSERLAIRCRHHWSRQHEKRLYGRSCRNDSQWRDNYGWIHGRRHVGAPSDELVKQHKSRLNVICSDAGAGKGVGKLFDAALVSILTASHIGLNPKAQQQMLAKQIVIDLVPQGTLVEPIRAGGCGLGGVLTPTGVGTIVEEGKHKVQLGGKTFLLKTALRADFALIHAFVADHLGNLTYVLTARNFNPVMVMAANNLSTIS